MFMSKTYIYIWVLTCTSAAVLGSNYSVLPSLAAIDKGRCQLEGPSLYRNHPSPVRSAIYTERAAFQHHLMPMLSDVQPSEEASSLHILLRSKTKLNNKITSPVLYVVHIIAIVHDASPS